GRGEARVAPAAPAAAGHEQPVAGPEDLAQDGAGGHVAHHGAGRHREDQVRARAAGLVLPLAVLAPPGPPGVAVAVVEQGVEVWVGLDVHAAAGAADAPVGAALGLVLEPGEGARARAAGAARDPHHRAIDEGHCPGLHPSRTVRQSSFTFFHWSKERSGFTIESTASIWPNEAPALSAPRRCEWSWRGTSSTAVCATVQSSRRSRSSPGRARVRP